MQRSSLTPTPPKKRRWRWLWRILGLLVLAAALLVVFWEHLPYQNALSAQLKRWLEARGLVVASLQVAHVGKQDAALRDVTLGQEHTLNIGHAKAHYRWEELRAGTVDRLEIEDVQLVLYEEASGWKIGGVEPLMPAPSKEAAVMIPVRSADFRQIPALEVKEGLVSVEARNGQARLPFTLSILKQPALSLSAQSSGIEAKMGTHAATIQNATFEMTLDEAAARWGGHYTLSGIALTGLKTAIPVLGASGKITATATEATVSFILRDKKKTLRAEGSLTLPMSNPKAGTLHLSKLSYPWGGGTISLAKPTRLALSGKKPVRGTLKITGVSLAALAEMAGEGKISATGKVAGVIPFTYHPSGAITIANGDLSAQGTGTISVAPELLPAQENAQMQEVQKTLEDFHYQTLGITLSLGEDESSVVHLRIEGANPAAFGGKKVKLNVNLSGDLIPLLRQSLLPLQDTKQLLKAKDTR